MSLIATNLSVSAGGQRVIEGIDFTLDPGQIVAVLGPNGAGKSSLLRAMSNEWQAAAGQVQLHNEALIHWDARQRATTLAVLPQRTHLNFDFTVAEVVRLGRTPHASGQQHDTMIASAALARVDGIGLAERLYTELSGGEQQRVQLARVLAQIWEPSEYGARMILLDEPAAAFDLAHQELLIDILQQLGRDGVGVLVALHDLNLAARVAHTMMLLKGGRMVAFGPPAEIVQPALIAEVFDVEVSVTSHPRTGTPLAIL